MEKIFEASLFTRESFLKIMEKHSYRELVKIPDNFRNSIFWNIAHVLVTQQLLCYRLSGLDIQIDEGFVKRYGKGSLATEEVEMADIEYVKSNLLSAMKQTQEDYNKKSFGTYKPYLTSTGIELKSIDDAVNFSGFHDGIHLGIVLSIMKLVK